jgi:antitoxin PrlF
VLFFLGKENGVPTSTLTSKGQVTIPKAIRERLGLSEGDTLEFTLDEAGRIVVRPRTAAEGVCGVLRDFTPDKPVTVEKMGKAVRHRAARKVSPGDR